MSLSSFGARFQFARLVQAVRGVRETDAEFADAIGVGSSSVTAYKAADEAPPASRTLAIAQRCGVDPGWLSFGEDSAAPSPSGWENWFAAQQRAAATSGQEMLNEAVAATSTGPRAARVEPKDVPAADPRKKPAAERGKGKRAG